MGSLRPWNCLLIPGNDSVCRSTATISSGSRADTGAAQSPSLARTSSPIRPTRAPARPPRRMSFATRSSSAAGATGSDRGPQWTSSTTDPSTSHQMIKTTTTRHTVVMKIRAFQKDPSCQCSLLRTLLLWSRPVHDQVTPIRYMVLCRRPGRNDPRIGAKGAHPPEGETNRPMPGGPLPLPKIVGEHLIPT